MKILILSELCSPSKYHEIEEERIKKILPSQQNYFWRLALSLSQLPGVSVDCISIPPVSASSHDKKIWRSETDIYNENLKLFYVGFINGKILKYVTVPISIYKAINRWFHENKNEEKYVICDALQSLYIKSVFSIASRFKTAVTGVVTDLPSYITETVHTNYNSLKMLVQKQFDKTSNEAIQKYDKYIFLTEYMNDMINIRNKKHIIVEGIAPDENVSNFKKASDSSKKVVVYAGGVYEKYGIVKLVEAFKNTSPPECCLHIYGSGDAVDYVKEAEKKDNRIKYCGVVSADKMLSIEASATLLINLRPADEEYTKYSFPSKTIEYMYSGTPLLSTRLAGIPLEYLPFIYLINDESIESITETLNTVLNKSNDELNSFGMKAKEFICQNKNSNTVAQKVLEFLSCKAESKLL